MKDNIRNTMESLEKNGFEPKYFETSEEAIVELLKEIDLKETIGIGGSMTIEGMGVKKKLEKEGFTVYTHFNEPDLNIRKEMIIKAMFTDVYLTSSNAITEDGKLVNIDGTGNRLAGMLFGHNRVIYICGVNKITKDYNEAYDRIKKIAAPKNTERLKVDTPCRYGPCTDCRSKQRICNATLVMDRKMTTARALVYIINEELGY